MSGPPQGYYGGGGQQGRDPDQGQQQGEPYSGQQPADPNAQQSQQQQGYWQQPPEPPQQPRKSGSGTGAVVVGIFLVLLGIWFLFRDEIGLDLGSIWPALAVGLGVIMVIAAFIPRRSRKSG